MKFLYYGNGCLILILVFKAFKDLRTVLPKGNLTDYKLKLSVTGATRISTTTHCQYIVGTQQTGMGDPAPFLEYPPELQYD